MTPRQLFLDQIISTLENLPSFAFDGRQMRSAAQFPRTEQLEELRQHATGNELPLLKWRDVANAELPASKEQSIVNAVYGKERAPDDQIASEVESRVLVYRQLFGGTDVLCRGDVERFIKACTANAEHSRRKLQERLTRLWVGVGERQSDGRIAAQAVLGKLGRLLSLGFIHDPSRCCAVLLSGRSVNNGIRLFRPGEIALILDVDAETVGSWLEKDEPAVRNVWLNYKKWLAWPEKRVLELFVERELTNSQIADKLGLRMESVREARLQATLVIQAKIRGRIKDAD